MSLIIAAAAVFYFIIYPFLVVIVSLLPELKHLAPL
jgi:hypothetical protein